MRFPRSVALSALVASGLAGSLSAQDMPRIHAIELTFAGGYFQPTGTSGQAGTLELTRRPSWVGSSHLDFYAPGGRLGFEVSAGYAPERIRQSTGGNAAGSRRTNMLFGTAKVVLGRSPRLSGISYMLGGGVGVLHRKKSVMDAAESSTDLGGVASLMVRFPIDGQVGLRLDAQNLIYSADYGLGSKLRNDLFMTAGLGISW
ncbi:MAG TPA: hypothetical protein VF187_06325 [Gemmatimonadales bacterium]